MSIASNFYICLFVICCGFNSYSQEEGALSKQLEHVDSLLSKGLNEEAGVMLEKLGQEIDQSSPVALQLFYFKYLGDYHLDEDAYTSAIAAYQQLEEFNIADLSEAQALQQAKAINDLGIAYMRTGKVEMAKQSHFKSLQLYKKFDNALGRSYNYGNLAIIYKELKQIDSALLLYEYAEKAAMEAEDTLGIGFHALSRGILYADNNDPILAMELLNKAIQVFRSLDNDHMAYYSSRILANTYVRVRDYALARPLLFEALRYFESQQDPVRIGLAYLSMAEMYYQTDQLDSGYHLVQKSIGYFDETGYAKGLGKAYHLSGQYYAKNGDYTSAISYFRRALSISEEGFKGMSSNILMALAHIFKDLGRPDEALIYADSAMTVAAGSPNGGTQRSYYRLQYEVNKDRGNASSALRYLELLDRVKSESFNQEKANEIARVEFNYRLESERAQAELTQQQQEMVFQQELRRQQWFVLSGFTIAGFLALIAFLYYRTAVIKKRKNQELGQKNTLIRKQNEELISKNQEISALREAEKQMADETLALKERELTTVTMLSHEKNSLLEQLGQQIGSLSGKVNEQVIPDLREIKKTIKANLDEESWSMFMYQFEKVHPRFFNDLKRSFPSLTQNDLRLCAYLKVGMDNKEIANISNITLAGVKKSINRMKKKMELDAETDLRDYLMSLA